MTDFLIAGGAVLRDGAFRVGDLGVAYGRIAAVSDAAMRIDARGLLVVPGLIDLHGDAFERQMQPRPGVDFDTLLALAETERQLLSNGITTAFHSVTLSWEPGLRSPGAWRRLLDALSSRSWACDMRIHLRWEANNLDALDMAIADIEAGRVHLMAFNDHMAAILKKLDDPFEGAKYAGRAGMKLAPFRALAEHAASHGPRVAAAQDRLAALCRAHGIPMASHDDETIEMRDAFAARGADICEFPVGEHVALHAKSRGDWIVMGSPNVVRGGSHLGWVSAADMIERGLCNVLASDYFYPALLQAPFVLADRGRLDLAQAFAVVTENPARAGKLADRGQLEDGMRADIVLVNPARRAPVATIVAGRVAWASIEGFERLLPA